MGFTLASIRLKSKEVGLGDSSVRPIFSSGFPC